MGSRILIYSMYTKAVVAHGGGPTAVINASLAGLIEECRRRGSVLYGARYGLAGLVRGDLVDLLAFDADLVRRIGEAPGSALGSSRLPFADEDYARLLDVFRRAEVHTFFYTGGNGSMDERKPEVARQPRLDGGPGVAAVLAAIDTEMVLGEEALRMFRVEGDLVNALPEFGEALVLRKKGSLDTAIRRL